ncbi:MAG: hypothetical protein AB1668_04885 [Nanoarchaeota archaeon]
MALTDLLNLNERNFTGSLLAAILATSTACGSVEPQTSVPQIPVSSECSEGRVLSSKEYEALPHGEVTLITTYEQYKELLGKNKYVTIEWSAKDCSQCPSAELYIAHLAHKYPEIKFATVGYQFKTKQTTPREVYQKIRSEIDFEGLAFKSDGKRKIPLLPLVIFYRNGQPEFLVSGRFNITGESLSGAPTAGGIEKVFERYNIPCRK